MRDLKLQTAERFEELQGYLTEKIKSVLGDKYDNQLYYVPSSLLSSGSAKTIKGQKYGWTTYILYMAPFRLNSLGINLCPKATEGCVNSCLFTSGRGSFKSVEIARLNKTEFFANARQEFMTKLVSDIKKIVARHEKMTEDILKEDGSVKINKNFAIRLNGTSDVDWDRILIDSEDGKNIFEVFPEVQFYDYTKIPSRVERSKAYKNYFVTFSLSEHNLSVAKKVLDNGSTIASVYFPTIPNKHLGYDVYDGDDSDLIFTYQKEENESLVIGLYLKTPTKTKAEIREFVRESLNSGFVNLVIDGEVVPRTEENINKVLEINYKSYKKVKI